MRIRAGPSCGPPLRLESLGICSSLEEKHAILDSQARIKAYVAALSPGLPCDELWKALGADDAYLLKCVVAIGQGHTLVAPKEMTKGDAEEGFKRMLEHARFLEEFYDVYGGLVGYQITVLQLMDDAIKAKARREATDGTQSEPAGEP
eukprot:2016244-Pyramimonas_sp.AAC.1